MQKINYLYIILQYWIISIIFIICRLFLIMIEISLYLPLLKTGNQSILQEIWITISDIFSFWLINSCQFSIRYRKFLYFIVLYIIVLFNFDIIVTILISILISLITTEILWNWLILCYCYIVFFYFYIYFCQSLYIFYYFQYYFLFYPF